MAITAPELLLGPRGRRLCIEYALRSEALAAGPVEIELPLWKALFDTVVAQQDQVEVVGWGEDYVPTPVAPDEVAARLRLVTPADPTEDMLLDVLRATVNSARYWREPDPEDVMARHWRVADALVGFADALLASPVSSWWAAPMRRKEQSRVRWSGAGPEGPRAQKAISRWRSHEERAEKRTRKRYDDPRQADTGQWWSIPPALPSTTGGLGGLGPVGRHLVEDFPLWQDAEVSPVKVPKKFDVVEITSADDWVRLCRRYPLDVTASRMQAWFRVTGHSGDWVIPDWRRVARHHDGVHLGVAPWLVLAGRALDVDEHTATLIAGFSPDETRWFVDLPS